MTSSSQLLKYASLVQKLSISLVTTTLSTVDVHEVEEQTTTTKRSSQRTLYNGLALLLEQLGQFLSVYISYCVIHS